MVRLFNIFKNSYIRYGVVKLNGLLLKWSFIDKTYSYSTMVLRTAVQHINTTIYTRVHYHKKKNCAKRKTKRMFLVKICVICGYSLSLSIATSAAFFPDISIAPKVGPILGSPYAAETAIPVTISPG